MEELALVTEAGVRGRHHRQGHVSAALQKVLGALDAAGDDVLVRRRTGGPSEPATLQLHSNRAASSGWLCSPALW
jgi:hypothetical protein